MLHRIAAWAASLVSARLGAETADPLDRIPRRRIIGSEVLERAEKQEAETAQGTPQAARWVACGTAWFHADRHDRARRCFERALAIDPAHSPALDALGTVHKSRAELETAIDFYRRAIEADPRNAGAFQNLLFTLLCAPSASEQQILDWHRRFAVAFDNPLITAPAGQPGLDPSKRLRIGYVSADLRDHVTGQCTAPILANHDKDKFKLFCYYDGRLADDFTRAMQAVGGTWRDMAPLDDRALADRIRADGIDILVDLSGHTPGNRILALTARPAPVQVSYLDYSATTGLASIDYRLTTASLDPEGEADPYYTESLYRLPGSYWAYKPPQIEEAASAASTARPGVLLSCLNSFYRVTDEALRIWARILRELPDARLALMGVPSDEETRGAIAKRLQGFGLDMKRVELFGILNYGHYIQLVRATDIALAPFPYNGAMTTFDCLWNGVPVVCMRGGPTFRSSMGRSILGLVGLEELAAMNPDEYAAAVVRLARDAARRQALREGLRARMEGSAICDARALTRNLETAFRDLWRRHCTPS